MSKLRNMSWCLSVLSLCGASTWAQNLPAPSSKDESQAKATLTAQERLDAIRHSLVEPHCKRPPKC